MYDGVEIDMLSLGDADSILVSRWNGNLVQRILIDGGNSNDADTIVAFLEERGATNLSAILCSHTHRDHVGGLIKIVKHPSIKFQQAWMHDIRKRVSAENLKKASSGNSSAADGVRQVVESTAELDYAFKSRRVIPQEPFAGAVLLPSFLSVLGPSQTYYDGIVNEFANVSRPSERYSLASLAALAGTRNSIIPGSLGLPVLGTHTIPLSSLLGGSAPVLPPARGVLSNSALSANPSTQPFNNTSTILGGIYGSAYMLFTADAGSDALNRIPRIWKTYVSWMQVPHHGSDGNLSKELIETFRPAYAYISACGDECHPDRAIVSGLVKVGSKVFSTHDPVGTGNAGNLQFSLGSVPQWPGYLPAVPLKGTGSPIPIFNSLSDILGGRR